MAVAAQDTGKTARTEAAPAETRITTEQAKELFALVDELIRFSSSETGLEVKSEVKRQMTTRDEVERYLDKKFA